MFEHAQRQSLPACRSGDSDLPYEDGVCLIRPAVCGNEADGFGVLLGDHAALGMVGAEQQVGVRRIQVQRWTSANQTMDGRAVGNAGFS